MWFMYNIYIIHITFMWFINQILLDIIIYFGIINEWLSFHLSLFLISLKCHYKFCITHGVLTSTSPWSLEKFARDGPHFPDLTIEDS